MAKDSARREGIVGTSFGCIWPDFVFITMDTLSHQDLYQALVRMDLMQEGLEPSLQMLTGGVSSDIMRIDLPAGPICVKRALPQLRVASKWRAPIERNTFEVEWIHTVAGFAPSAVPKILGVDRQAGLFAMGYFEPQIYPVWKQQLRDGVINPDTAQAVATRIVQIHSGTADNAELAVRFATDHIFHPIRLEPYLLATAEVHQDCALILRDIAQVTATTKRALVHGDVSPKNILVGPHGPVLLDAECAWYGDPAFDVAFCLNHLLLKCMWQPQWSRHYLVCFDRFVVAYLAGVNWEAPEHFEARACLLLPGLLLGRIDGKSPVEYISAEADRERVRRVAKSLLKQAVTSLDELRHIWQHQLKEMPA